jgi:hypothetical protein
MTDVTLFWSLYNAGLNGDFGAAADMIDGDCGYAMLPTMEVSRGKPDVMQAMGRGAEASSEAVQDRPRQLP